MRKRKIFLVDDDFDDQLIFQSALETVSTLFDFETAYDGIDALTKIKDPAFRLPDLIFTDLNMPKMNGIRFLEAVKKLDYYQQIPVIVYSTSASPADINTCKSLGAEAYLVKPSYFSELCRQLESTLRKQHII